MIDKLIKFRLNIFNIQSDNTILKVTFSNINTPKERLKKIRDNINKLLEPNHCYITNNFFELKIQELYLAYEYEEKLQQEKEEQWRIKQQMREEEKVRREITKAEAEAEKEEFVFQKALEKTRQEAATSNAYQKSKYEMKVKELEKQLAKAQQKRERALSMAQKTQSGHVYVISNIESFGEKIYKIGVTRRIEPRERVKKL